MGTQGSSDSPGLALSGVARALALALAVVGGAALAYRYLVRRSLPKCRGDVCPGGLEQDVEVIRDRWGVPHVYASSAHDLFYAQGYVHAQDRLWQMELQRRVASGTFAEVAGKTGLQTDRFFRRVGLRRAAECELAQLDDEARLAIEAYVEGINAFVSGHLGRLPVEFALLRYVPERWTVLDVLTWGKLLGWALSCNWETELLRASLIDRLGAEGAAALEPSYPDGHPIAAAPGQDHYGVDGFALAQFQEARRFLGAIPAEAASNAWAVDGAKSATGLPLLANDPHLPPQLPGLWYEVHLVGAGFDVAGASVPGVPGVVIGHNQRIAWGVTMSLADSQDLYVEQLNPANPLEYEYQGRWEAARLVREVIRVKGRRSPVVEDVVITRHGPVLSPALPGQRRTLALRSATLDPSQPGAILDLNRAGNWDEFRAALARWGVASLSFVYADVEGNIGYQLAGRHPIRARGDGLAPAPGWTGEHEWLGYLPFEELPSVLNPQSHYVVTANNKIVPDDYPHVIGREWAEGFRARRICDLLEGRQRHDVSSFQAMQRDLLSLAARELVRHLLRTPPEDELSARALEMVRAWDCRIAADSSPAALYEVWRHYLLRNVFGPKLGEQVDRYLGLGHESLIRTHVYQIRVSSHLLKLLQERPADWFVGEGDEARRATSGAASQSPGSGVERSPGPDVAVGCGEARGVDHGPSARRNVAGQGSARLVAHPRSRAAGSAPHRRWPRDWDEALRLSLREAVLFLRAALGEDPTSWRWGDLHQLTFRHALGVGPLGRLLNRGPFPMGGDTDTVCQAAADVAAPFLAHGSTVSYRQIVDLADFDRSLAVLPCGQSGHPASRHYCDMTPLWLRGEYHPMPFSRQAVLAAAHDRLVLRADRGRGAP